MFCLEKQILQKITYLTVHFAGLEGCSKIHIALDEPENVI